MWIQKFLLKDLDCASLLSAHKRRVEYMSESWIYVVKFRFWLSECCSKGVRPVGTMVFCGAAVVENVPSFQLSRAVQEGRTRVLRGRSDAMTKGLDDNNKTLEYAESFTNKVDEALENIIRVKAS